MARYCRSCGKPIVEGSRFCEGCGLEVSGGAAPETRASPASPSPFGAPASPSPFGAPGSPPMFQPGPPPPTSDNRWIWLVVAGMAVLGLFFVGGIFFVFFMVRQAEPTTVSTPLFVPPPLPNAPSPFPDDPSPFPPRPPTPTPTPDADTIFRVPVGDSPQRGRADALVTIVEFTDFQCPFCGRVQDALDRLERERGADVRLVFKHNPLPFHQNAMPAAEASLAAGRQGKFWEMHRLLFANQTALDRASLERYAREIGLDIARFRADLDSHALRPPIEADQRLAAEIGARGTPTFFINGRTLRGAQPYERFVEMVDAEAARARAVVARGVAPGLVYEEITRGGRTTALPPTNVPTPPVDDPNRIFVIPPHPGAPARGAALARATLVEFADFECPFSGRVQTTLAELERTMPGRVRIEFRHFPLPFHGHAQLAHEAAAEANVQGKFWQYHDVLFQNQRALERADLERYAAQVGLDLRQFRAALDDHRHAATIRADVDAANRSGARIGTPSFFLRGKLLQGAQPLDALRRFVEAAP